MPLEIIHGDISNLSFHVDAIVNVSHPNPEKIGFGVDQAIHKKAGPELLRERAMHGRIEKGQSITTSAYGLNASHVIHTQGPCWREGKHGEEDVLRCCYDSALHEAVRYRCQRIAFPLIASGNQGFPINTAYRIATDAFRVFCENHDAYIYLVVLDEQSTQYCRRQREIRDDSIPKDIDAVIASEYFADGTLTSKEAVHALLEESDKTKTAHEDAIDEVLYSKNPEFRDAYKMLEKLVYGALENRRFTSTYAFCRQAHLHEKHFSNHIVNKKDKGKTRPEIHTLLAYAITLEMNQRQITELFRRFNYYFPSDDKFDKIVVRKINEGCYSIMEINTALDEELYKDNAEITKIYVGSGKKE